MRSQESAIRAGSLRDFRCRRFRSVRLTRDSRGDALSRAKEREESRGAHAREDFPDRNDDDWMKHTLAWVNEEGQVNLKYRPVHLQTLTNEVQSFPPKERSY